MANTPLDRLAEASDRLDPASRALLDLWLGRDLDDPAIAEVIGSSTERVTARRMALLERLSQDADLPLGDVHDGLRRLAAAAPARATRRNDEPPPRAAATPPQPTTADPGERAGGRAGATPPQPTTRGSGERAGARAAAPPPQAAREEGGARGGRGRLALVLALLAAGVLLVILLVTRGGDDDDSTPPTSATSPASPTSAGTPLTLRALPGGPAGATGEGWLTSDGRLRLRLRGLSGDAHQLWLFNSILESRSVARLRGPRATVEVRVPEGRSRYRWLDLSLETDANPSHSGRSVLRVELPR